MDEVYLFEEAAEKKLGKEELGGKGYGLVEMTRLGLPVPPGIIITTKMCNEFFKNNKKIWSSLETAILNKVAELEKKTGKQFNNPKNPLLVSVRSGAPMSMPGMLDTVLNLGINDNIVKALAENIGDERFAYDTYRRFIQLFGKIVLGVPDEAFSSILEEYKKSKNAKNDLEINAEGWKEIVKEYKNAIKKHTGKDLPQDPKEQLLLSVAAVFNSWWNQRASEYRKIYGIPDTLGTAVNIVMMVYGNLDDKSATGVAFTRNPSTGEKGIFGEILIKAQGEDVVSGVRTPLPVERLKELLPEAYDSLINISNKLENYFKDMQDIEFTIEKGKLYMLQTRTGKRNAQAALKVALDMADEGIITKGEAVLRIEPHQLEQLLYKQIDPNVKAAPFVKGLAASPGAAIGKLAFTVEEAKEAKQKGMPVILVRPETTPEDIAGIAASDGVLTARGGMTSHAAVVTRGMGKPCIVGAEDLVINAKEHSIYAKGKRLADEYITIDGGTGTVYEGKMPLVEPKLSGDLAKLLSWADEFRKLGIRANADTPEMARKARENGAEGIGLDRTERMFNAPERLAIVQKMILAESKEERSKYLEMLKPMQKSDFIGILEAMQGLPVTIRLLDFPLHEFLPKLEQILPEVVEQRIKTSDKAKLEENEKILARVMELREQNPMMGQRGVRLSLVYPEIYEMQIEAIFEAVSELSKKGKKQEVEIMISQVAEANEVKKAREIIDAKAKEVMDKLGVKFEYKVGSMIETPRAALTASKIAEYADFFSFGTNDLTQATFAFSRDDVEAKFIPFYINSGVLASNPFETLDYEGVGRLIKLASEEGKSKNPKLKVGVCGEHGGDPKSIELFNSTYVDYVSCSPYRVPVARLAAAQAELRKSFKASSTV
ncbi:MAG: pyruvate, phosphate dikinase [Candidatus Micrarchaeaceae archaeon]